MPESIKVVIRFRNRRETDTEYDYSVYNNTVEIKDEINSHLFKFDAILQNTSQDEFFNRVAKDAILSVADGYNSTILAYGPTGTGKSYTMFGSIIPLSSQLLFQTLSGKSLETFTIKVTFLEIYRETINDLLDPASTQPLRIRQGEFGNYVQGISEKYVTSADKILSLIEEGAKNRVVASTALNSVSSRSHAVLTLTVHQTHTDGSTSMSKLHLVDLAGSENVGKSEVQGTNLIEAQMINKSLSSLGNVIYALTEKGRDHIPYRDSRLTFLLQDSLGGNSKSVLICTASSVKSMFHETVATFKFATRAKQIKNQPKVNKQRSTETLEKLVEDWIQRYEELKKQYEQDCEISRNVKEDTEVVNILKMRNKRLEQKVEHLQQRLENERNAQDEMKQLIVKHKVLAQNVAENLYESRIQNVRLREYKQFHDAVLECARSNPSLLEWFVKSKAIPQ